MPPSSHPRPALQRVRDALAVHGIAADVREFGASTATAAHAAAAIGTTVDRIVKSLVFADGERAVLVLASGTNRVAPRKLRELTGRRVERADADRVRRVTGFAIGGVPPVGHATSLPVYVDRDLLAHDLVWAAAGTPNAVFPIRPADLVRVTGGEVADVKEEGA